MAIHFLNAEGSLKSIEYSGRVLKVMHNVSYQIMSDIWGSADKALVWDAEKGQPKEVYIRFCDYNWDSNSHAEVDATDEVKTAYRNYLIQQEFAFQVGTAKKNAALIVKDCVVAVVRGRKVPKGTKGKVVVMLEQANGYGYRQTVATKLGIATSDVMVDKIGKNGKVYKSHRDMVWVWAYNCERQDVAEVDENEMIERAIRVVDRV